MAEVRSNRAQGAQPNTGQPILYPAQTGFGDDRPFDDVSWSGGGGSGYSPAWSTQFTDAYRFDNTLGSAHLAWFFDPERGSACGGQVDVAVVYNFGVGDRVSFLRIDTIDHAEYAVQFDISQNVYVTGPGGDIGVLQDSTGSPYLMEPNALYHLEWSFDFTVGGLIRVNLYSQPDMAYPDPVPLGTLATPGPWTSTGTFGYVYFGTNSDTAAVPGVVDLGAMSVNNTGVLPSAPTDPPGVLTVPPIDAGASLETEVIRHRAVITPPAISAVATPVVASFGLKQLDVPPIVAGAQQVPVRPSRIVRAAPISAGASVRAPLLARLRRGLSTPLNGAVVPVAEPDLTVAVAPIKTDPTLYSDHALDIDIQVATGTATGTTWADAVTYRREVVLIASTTFITVRHNDAGHTPVADGTIVWWRARLVIDDDPQGWTTPATFTVNSAAGNAEVPMNWSVQTGPTGPHLWAVHPGGGITGTKVTVIGQGFPDNATVTIAGTAAPKISQTRVPATTHATGSARRITVADGIVCDPQHDEIVVYVPDIGYPGGPLVVTGDNGS